MMSQRYIHFESKQLYCTLKLPTEIYLSPHRMADVAILKFIRDPSKLNILESLDVLFLDGIGQVSSELLSMLDIIQALGFYGPKYELTNNVEGKCSQQHISLLCDIPLQKILDDKINILVGFFGIKDVDFDAYAKKDYF